MLRRAASLGSGGGWRGEDALAKCTESLGSESGDVGSDAEIDHQLGQQAAAAAGEEPHQAVASPEKRPPRCLPPPMPRAAEGAFMRAERRGGRLILTEVRGVEQRRREVFRASRNGGRLRLQFAANCEEASCSPDGEPPLAAGAETGAAGVLGTGCCNGTAGEFCEVAAGAGRRRVEIGAVMGT